MSKIYLQLLREILRNQHVMMRCIAGSSAMKNDDKDVLHSRAMEMLSLTNSEIFSEQKEPD